MKRRVMPYSKVVENPRFVRRYLATVPLAARAIGSQLNSVFSAPPQDPDPTAVPIPEPAEERRRIAEIERAPSERAWPLGRRSEGGGGADMSGSLLSAM